MKHLIIYFSHTGENWMQDGLRIIDKGNTEIVAEKLAKLTNSDLFKVEEVNKYPVNYKECCDIAKEELNSNKRPEIVNKIDNIDEYNTIYICTPIWWGHMPMPMFTLLEKLDFNNKIVKFIVTHEGSGLGSIPEDVNNLCVGADIKEGLAIKSSSADTCDSLIENWL